MEYPVLEIVKHLTVEGMRKLGSHKIPVLFQSAHVF
jgi:hypothetical protein